MASSVAETPSFCNKCQGETRHATLSIHSRHYTEADEAFPRVIAEEWIVIQCRGCDSIKVCVTQNSTDFKTPRETHYPAVESRRLPKWALQLPDEFQELFREIYKALNAECPCLSTMGVRALIDQMLNDRVGDVGGFAMKLGEAVKNGLLTDAQRQMIEAAVEAGHAASHRGFRPTSQQLSDALDIAEHALMSGYVLGRTSSRQGERI
jgi:hypothetical protein